MIYTTNGITNNKMKEIETEGIQADFEYIMNFTQDFQAEWREKTETLNKTPISRAKKNGPYFIPGVIEKTEQGFKRKNKSVLLRSLVVIDIDETDFSFEGLFKEIKGKIEKYKFLLYPTVSHTNEKTKARLIVEPSKLMNKTEYEATVQGISKLIDVEVDSASKVWSQHMGLPVNFVGYEDEFKKLVNAGEPYEVVKIETLENQKEENREKEMFNLPDQVLEGERNKLMFKYVSSLQAKNLSDEAIRAAAAAENNSKLNPPLTDEELEVILNSVLKRFSKGPSEDYIIDSDFGDAPSEEGEKKPADEVLPVFEADGKYQKTGPKGAVIQISNFITKPIRFIEVQDKVGMDELDALVIFSNGKRIQRSFRPTDFDDVNRFSNATDSLEARFTGNKTDLQYIKSLVSRKVEKTITGYSTGGMQKIDKQWYFITSEGAVNSQGEVREDIIHSNAQGIETSLLDYDPITSEELERVSYELFHFNSPAITAGILGYVGAIFFKERLWRDYKTKFSHMLVSGSAGSGKSSSLEGIIIPLLGIIGGSHGASGATKFVMDRCISSSNTLPYILDEYKPESLPQHIMTAISNICRVSYDRLKSSRGTRNQEIEDLFLTAPLIMFGESGMSETAVVERSLLLTFSKKESRMHKRDFEKLKNSKELSKLGRSLLNKALSMNDKTMDNILFQIDVHLQATCEIKDERLVNTLKVLFFGLSVIKMVFNELGLNFENETKVELKKLFRDLQLNMIEENLNGGDSTKAAVDTTLELMGQALKSRGYFNQDYIINKPYAGSRVIGLRVQELHAVMTRYIKEFNIQEKFLSLNDFKKQMAKTEYFVESSKKINILKDGKETSRRYLTFDMDKAEIQGVDTDGFEYYLRICDDFTNDEKDQGRIRVV